MILFPIFQRRHGRVFLEVLAKKGGIGEIQVVRNLLHRHVRETQALLNGFHRKKQYQLTRPTVHGLPEKCRQILGSNVELIGKILDPTDTSVTPLHQMHELRLRTSGQDGYYKTGF